ncbi:hypothetical protein RLIN73S_00388 [Rhodanobacter lindaniclasticus]
MQRAGQCAACHRRLQQRPQLEARWLRFGASNIAHRLGPAFQQLAAEHTDAAVGAARRAFRVQLPLRVEREVALRVMWRVVHHQQVRTPRGFGGQGGEVGVAPDVAADGENGLRPQQRQGVEQAAAGFQRLRAFVHVADAQAPARAIAQDAGKLLGEMRGVDRHVVHADRGELLQMPDDQRLAAHAQQRLGRAVGQRAHALAAAGGEDQRVPHAATRLRSRPCAWRSSSAAKSASSG